MGRTSMPQGRGSLLHNRRDYEKIGKPIPSNIDVTRSWQNVTFVDKDIRAAYEEIFGEALREYNSKQKRADRRIENYYEHIKKSKNGEKLFYEDVLQWGSKEDFIDSPTNHEAAKQALWLYIKNFERRNPNLKLIGAYIHLDEASPHLHFDYIPVATGYSRGLAVRNSLDRAMKEMGYVPEKESRKNNATKLWKENERAYFADICRQLGLEVEAERAARGSLSVEEYKEARDEMREELLSEIEHEYNDKRKQIDKMDEIASYFAAEGREAISAENMTLPERKSFLGKIEAPAREGVFIDDMSKEQIDALTARAASEERIADKIAAAEKHCETIIAAARGEAEAIKAEATAERNATVARAERIITTEQSIISRARAFADNLRKEFGELTAKVAELTAKVTELLKRKEKLEPEVRTLQQKYDELSRASDIMTGKLENEINQSRFHVPRGGFNSADVKKQWEMLNKGKLIALYRDGTQRIVTRNPQGGMDYKTLDDERAGLCRVGWFEREEKVSVPRSLLHELIRVRDRSKEISPNLERMIEQQREVELARTKVIKKEKDDFEIGN